MKVPASSRGTIKDFEIAQNIRIGDWHEVSAIYEGDIRSAYFSLTIKDRDGVEQSFRDNNSVGSKFLSNGNIPHIGKINLSNGLYESKWKFRPTKPLYAGRAKAIVGIFEDKKLMPLVIQEKDIHLI